MADGSINFKVTLDTSELRSGAAAGRSAFQSVGQEAQVQGAAIDAAFRKVGVTIAGVFTAQKALEFASSVISVRKEIEGMETAFTTLLGSEEKAAAMFGEIRQFAASTPMNLKDLASGAQTLLAFNYDADKVMTTLRALGDISMGDAQKFQSLTLAFSQMSATGKLMGQDLLQMINAGFNPLTEMSRTTGKTLGELKEEMSAGAVSAQMVEDAFLSATAAGGKFNGMLEAQGQTMKGAIAQLEGAYDDMLNEMGEKSEGVVTAAVSGMSSMLQHYEEIGEAIALLVSMYGTYKAAVIAANVVQTYNNTITAEAALQKSLAAAAGITLSNAEAAAAAKTQLLNAAQAKLNATLLANPYALAAAAAVGLVYAVYKVATNETEAEKAANKLSQAFSDSEAKIAAEKVKLDTLFGTLDACKKGTEDYERAKQAILDQYGDYLKGLGKEVAQLEDVEAAYKAITAAVEKSAKAKAKAAYTEEAEGDFQRVYGENAEEIQKMLVDKFGARTGTEYYIKLRPVLDGGKTLAELPKELRKAVFDEDFIEWDWGALNNGIVKRINAVSKARGALQGALRNANTLFGEDGVSGGKTPSGTNTDTKAGTKTHKAKKDSASDKKDSTASDAEDRYRRLEQIRQRQLANSRQFGFDMMQEEINGMQEGYDKEVAQNRLNYEKMLEQNRQRKEDMLEQLRDMAELQWENADPKAKKGGKAFDRKAAVPDNALDDGADISKMPLEQQEAIAEMRSQLQGYSDFAASELDRANTEALKGILDEVRTYEQRRTEIQREYAAKRDALYETNADGGRGGLKRGVTEGNVDELRRQEEEALAAVDENFAQREAQYQAWCEQIANMTLDRLEDTLAKAKDELAKLEKSGGGDGKQLAAARAKVSAVSKAAEKKKAQTDSTPGKSTIEQWKDLYEVLDKNASQFEKLGDAIGGTAGKALKAAAEIATGTLSMINGIVQLTTTSGQAMQTASATAASSMKTMESASVILTVISAAIQVAMAIASLFNDDESKQDHIESLQERIDQLQWELDNSDTVRLQKRYGTAVERVAEAYQKARAAQIEAAVATKDWSRALDAIRGRVSENAELMQKSVAALADGYAKMAYTADKALGTEKYSAAREQMENIARQQLLLQEQIDTEKSKKDSDDDQIKEWQEKMEELAQDAADVINDMMEDIIGGAADEIAEELADAFFDAFENGEDAAEAWGDKVKDIVGDVVKKMLVSQVLESQIGKVFDKYKTEWFGEDGEFKGEEAVRNTAQGLADDLNQVGEVWAATVNALPDEMKQYLTGDGASREGASSGIASASQDSVDELNARMTTVQSHTYSISENTKILVSNTAAILGSVQAIEEHAAAMSDRLASVEGNVKVMRNTLDDFATRGMKVK